MLKKKHGRFTQKNTSQVGSPCCGFSLHRFPSGLHPESLVISRSDCVAKELPTSLTCHDLPGLNFPGWFIYQNLNCPVLNFAWLYLSTVLSFIFFWWISFTTFNLKITIFCLQTFIEYVCRPVILNPSVWSCSPNVLSFLTLLYPFVGLRP